MAKGIMETLTDTLNPTLEFFNTKFRHTLDFTWKNLFGLFFKFLKVHLASLFLGIGAMLFFLLIMALAFMAFPNQLSPSQLGATGNIAMISVVLLITFIYYWVMETIAKSANLIIDEQAKGKYSGIWPLSGQLMKPMLVFLSFNAVLFILVFGIPALVLYFLSGNTAILAIVYLICLLLFGLGYVFFAQFWLWEYLVAKKGILESLKASFNLAKENVLGVIVFDIALLLALAIPFAVFQFIGAFLGAFMNISTFASLAVDWVLALATILSFMLAAIAVQSIGRAVTDLIYMPFMHAYWSHIRNPPVQAVRLSPEEKKALAIKVKSAVGRKASK